MVNLETMCLAAGTAIVVSILMAAGVIVALEVADGRTKFCQ